MTHWKDGTHDFQVGDRVQDTVSHRHVGTVESVIRVPLYTVRFDGHKSVSYPDEWNLRRVVKCTHEGGEWPDLPYCADCGLDTPTKNG